MGGRDKDITRLCSNNSKTTEKAEHIQRNAGNRPPCASATRGYEQSLVITGPDLGALPPRRAGTAAPLPKRDGGEGWQRRRPEPGLEPGPEPGERGDARV